MIIIAKDYNGIPVGIISCKNIEAARAYYQGMGLAYNSLKEFDIKRDRENEKMGYITPLLKTETITISTASNRLIDTKLVTVPKQSTGD